jgi:hypothetical protein
MRETIEIHQIWVLANKRKQFGLKHITMDPMMPTIIITTTTRHLYICSVILQLLSIYKRTRTSFSNRTY